MQTPSNHLQQRIDVLRAQHGETPALQEAVARLLQSEGGVGGATQGYTAYGAGPSTPQAGLHGASTPSSRSGRAIKPVKHFTTPGPASRSTPQPGQHYRPSSSLNPHAHRPAPPPAARVPLSSDTAPVPPLTAIADPRYQAQYSTYPARMRLGTSALMQPNVFAASGKGDAAAPPPPGAGKRARASVNYAELEGMAGDEQEEARDGLVPKRGLMPGQSGGEPNVVWGDGKSYLGAMPPGNMVVVQPAIRTKHGV